MFPGRAYVVRERKGVLERLVDERMTSVGAGASLRGSVAPSVVGGPRDVGMAAEPEGEGEGDVEMNEGAEGTPSRDKGKAKEAEPEHDAVDEDIPEPEYGTPWDKRRARQLDSVLVSSMVLGIGRQDHLPNDVSTMFFPFHLADNQDLLLSLHSHAAHFFSTHGALRCPRPVWRGKLWDNRKRLEVGAELAARGNVRELQRVNAAYELERAVYEADLANPAYRRHKRADMHTAMEGSALLALGE
jgi:hypothetical protein